jgi:hypothetical protein
MNRNEGSRDGLLATGRGSAGATLVRRPRRRPRNRRRPRLDRPADEKLSLSLPAGFDDAQRDEDVLVPRQLPDRRRALELLASCRGGCTEAIMLAHGFTIEVARVRITEAGDGCSRD